MSFKERLRYALESSPKARKEIASDAKIPKRTIDKWLEIDDSNPSAIQLIELAMKLNTTVEYLIKGERGKEYVIKWAEAFGVKVKPPPGLSRMQQKLCELVSGLSDEQIEEIIKSIKFQYRIEDVESTPRSEAI